MGKVKSGLLAMEEWNVHRINWRYKVAEVPRSRESSKETRPSSVKCCNLHALLSHNLFCRGAVYFCSARYHNHILVLGRFSTKQHRVILPFPFFQFPFKASAAMSPEVVPGSQWSCLVYASCDTFFRSLSSNSQSSINEVTRQGIEDGVSNTSYPPRSHATRISPVHL